MTKEEIKAVELDTEGLSTYEFIVNHLYELNDDQLNEIIDNLSRIDSTGQYLASASRYMHAVEAARFAPYTERMIGLTIDRDREHRYIGELMTAFYGNDYKEKAGELSGDNNFRRMYKRLFPEGAL